MHTVLDTNVIISALLFRGASAAVHQAVSEGRLVPFISPPMFRKYAKMPAYQKFGLSDQEIAYLPEHFRSRR